MPAYLPIKLNRGHRAKRRSNMPARSARTGKFLTRGHKANKPKKHSVSRKRHLAGLKAARTRKRHESHRTNRPKSRRRSNRRHRRNLPSGFHFTKPSKHRIGQGFPKNWPHKAGWDWTGSYRKNKRRKNRGGKRRRNSGRSMVKWRTRTNVVHRTKRLRNPCGFDSQDALGRLGTWGKIGLCVLYGLGGLVIAFGIPKGLAVVTGKDAFQRGWGGVATSAVASVTVGGLVYLLSKRTGLGLLAAAGVGVALLALNALSPKAAQYVIPLNEATLAAMLPTFSHGGGTGPQDFHPGGWRSQPARQPGTPVRGGPADFYPPTAGTRSSTSGDESAYYGSALAPKERF